MLATLGLSVNPRPHTHPYMIQIRVKGSMLATLGLSINPRPHTHPYMIQIRVKGSMLATLGLSVNPRPPTHPYMIQIGVKAPVQSLGKRKETWLRATFACSGKKWKTCEMKFHLIGCRWSFKVNVYECVYTMFTRSVYSPMESTRKTTFLSC